MNNRDIANIFKLMTMVFVLFHLTATFGFAQITNITGSVSHKNIITISGSSFGIKSPAAPWLYDDFEGYPVGTGMDDKSPTIGTITYERYSYDGVQGVYANDKAYSGSQSAKTVNSSSGSTTRDHFAFSGQAAQKRFISYMAYRTDLSGVPKGDRQTANLGNGYNNRLYDSPPNFGHSGNIFTNNGTSFELHGWIGHATNRWQRLDQWIVISDVDVANGRYDYYVDNVLDETTGDYATCTSGATNGCQIDSWISPNYVNIYNYGGARTNWVDDLYVDNTQARVELCSGSTWSNRSTCTLQVPSAWSSTSITASVNTGAFNTGQTAYFYVVDADGNVNNNGYQVVIGEISSATVTHIAPPGALRIN